MKTKQFTIKDYVLRQREMTINEWIEQITIDKLSKHQSIILSCADHFNKISVDLSTSPLNDFINTITL